MTDKKALQLLNLHYSENMTSEQAVNSLIYLTSKNRKPRTTVYQLYRAHRNGTLADTLKRLDPIAFQCAKSDLK